MTATSPMTGTPGRHLFDAEVLGSHTARYYADDALGSIFVDRPHWLEEAYSSAIATTDTGILARHDMNVARVSWLIDRRPGLFDRGVDLGAGYGLFVRGMRDRGYPFFWQDKYAENLVARGFEAEEGTYAIAVAFEVLEHLENPLEFIAEMRARYGFHTLVFTATCFEDGTVPERDWWYWAFETGQHVSFFSERALDGMAGRLDMNLFKFGADLYAFSTEDWAGLHYRRPLGIRLRDRLTRRRRPSLTEADYQDMKGRLQKRNPVTR